MFTFTNPFSTTTTTTNNSIPRGDSINPWNFSTKIGTAPFMPLATNHSQPFQWPSSTSSNSVPSSNASSLSTNTNAWNNPFSTMSNSTTVKPIFSANTSLQNNSSMQQEQLISITGNSSHQAKSLDEHRWDHVKQNVSTSTVLPATVTSSFPFDWNKSQTTSQQQNNNNNTLFPSSFQSYDWNKSQPSAVSNSVNNSTQLIWNTPSQTSNVIPTTAISSMVLPPSNTSFKVEEQNKSFNSNTFMTPVLSTPSLTSTSSSSVNGIQQQGSTNPTPINVVTQLQPYSFPKIFTPQPNLNSSSSSVMITPQQSISLPIPNTSLVEQKQTQIQNISPYGNNLSVLQTVLGQNEEDLLQSNLGSSETVPKSVRLGLRSAVKIQQQPFMNSSKEKSILHSFELKFATENKFQLQRKKQLSKQVFPTNQVEFFKEEQVLQQQLSYRHHPSSMTLTDLDFELSSPHVNYPTLTNSEYYTIPTMKQIQQMNSKQLTQISNFTIGRVGVGKLIFKGMTNITGLVLNQIVKIEEKYVELYPEGMEKPKFGQGLYKSCQVILHHVMPSKHHSVQDYETILRKCCKKNNFTFVSYVNYEWTFEIHQL